MRDIDRDADVKEAKRMKYSDAKEEVEEGEEVSSSFPRTETGTSNTKESSENLDAPRLDQETEKGKELVIPTPLPLLGGIGVEFDQILAPIHQGYTDNLLKNHQGYVPDPVPVLPDHRLHGGKPKFWKSSEKEAMLASHPEPNVDPKGKAKMDGNLKIKCSSSSDLEDYDDEYNPIQPLILEMEIPHSNRLLIPYLMASKYFPPLASPDHRHSEETLQLSGQFEREWHMTLTYHTHERAFLITRGWQQYLRCYHLKPMDYIRIYKPACQLHYNHFSIEHEKRTGFGLGARIPTPPEFREENFLFEWVLAASDVEYGRLVISKEQVGSHFPGISVSREEGGPKQVPNLMKFTDETRKDWYMFIVYSRDINEYMILDGWMEFVEEHELKAEDVIKFYKHLDPCHSKHFLIRCRKRTRSPKDDTKRTQPGNHGGLSHDKGKGKGKGKGKEIVSFG